MYENKIGSLKVPLVPTGNFPVTWSKYIDFNGTPLDQYLDHADGNLPQYTLEEYQAAAEKGEIEEGKAFIITDDNENQGVPDYDELDNKPSINGVELKGNLSAEALGMQLNIPRYTKAEYEAVKGSIPVNTLFIITDDDEEE